MTTSNVNIAGVEYESKVEAADLSADVNWVIPGQPFWETDNNKRTDAHIDWIRDLGFDLADAFKTAADFAVQKLEAGGDGTHPDRFALPILYLYRHAFELQLKEIVRCGVRANWIQPSGKVKDLLSKEHNLRKLWIRAERVIKRAWPNGDERQLNQIKSYLEELDKVDPDGQRFRYDRVNRKEERAKETLESASTALPTPRRITRDELLIERPEDVKDRPPAVRTLPEVFGLLALADRADKLYAFLDGTLSGIDDMISASPY